MSNTLKIIYRRLVIDYSLVTLIILALVFGWLFSYVGDFRMDASADALLLEGDVDLKISRDLSKRYAVRDFLFVAFTPDQDLFSDSSLHIIAALRDELRHLELTDSVTSLLDVPLVRQIEGPLSKLAENYRTLESADVDKDKAREELVSSPVYKELVISLDGNTTALQVYLKSDGELAQLSQRRSLLLQKLALSDTERIELQGLEARYVELKDRVSRMHHDYIVAIRDIMDRYKDFGSLYLGGVTMISDDMVSFIKNDLLIFGIGVLVFLVMMLSFIFRRLRWVLLPMLSCVYAGTLMVGLLGFAGWAVTVISSNFIALMLIITMSMNIHLVVRYRQLSLDLPDLDQRQLVLETVRAMVWPCLYTALTTIVAFASLLISGIKPVIDFGWMMTAGLSVTFVTTFLLFPALLSLLPKIGGVTEEPIMRLMPVLSAFTVRHGNVILVTALLLLLLALFGISKLQVENSFISYFGKDTEIYRGLKLIDEKLGGTTTLDILLKFEDEAEVVDDLDSDFGEFDLGAFDDQADSDEDYWFTPAKLERIKAVHDYLERLPAIGKVLSLASIIRIGEDINQGEFNAFELAIAAKRMPAEMKAAMIDPYVSIADNEARISLRVMDSMEDLRRNELLEQIRDHLADGLQIRQDSFVISGLMVLYNNMLQSLFKSQILTLGVVMFAIFLMMMLLFRSWPLAAIGIIPNFLAAIFILGFMSLLGLPLDMMTITVAAITIGIAVDNSIHYLYRFRQEFAIHGDYVTTLHYCHRTIGRAVFYNAITIIIGFSILALSNFVPTVYFGLLTALAILVALLAALTLLPRLILAVKPF